MCGRAWRTGTTSSSPVLILHASLPVGLPLPLTRASLALRTKKRIVPSLLAANAPMSIQVIPLHHPSHLFPLFNQTSPLPFPDHPLSASSAFPTLNPQPIHRLPISLCVRRVLEALSVSFHLSPPVHRECEHRRLRKKSRPPCVDDNIYELDDRT